MLRITAGEYKGRELKTPPETVTRPSHAKLRQALFNSIQFVVPGAKVLDLFSGSGALGIEAASRGAHQVFCVESDEKAYKVLLSNISTLKAQEQIRALKLDVIKDFKQLKKYSPFQVILADPPYDKGYELQILEQIDKDELLEDEAILVLEWSPLKSKKFKELPESVGSLTKIREQKYGDSVLSHYQRSHCQQSHYQNRTKKETIEE